MTEENPQSPTDPLVLLCKDFLSQNAEKWPPDENLLALALLTMFQATPLLTPENLEQFGSALGIQVSFHSLPPEMAGHNCSYLSCRAIFLAEEESIPGALAHTFFHEMREILEGIFVSLDRPTVSPAEMENRAEKFAVAARTESMNKYLLFWMQQADGIQVKWQRWGAFILIAVLMLANGLYCVYLPQFEEEIRRNNRGR